MKIDGVEVTVEHLPGVTEEEIKNNIAYVRYNVKEGELVKLTMSPGKDPEDAILTYEVQLPKFERIRRITGKPTK